MFSTFLLGFFLVTSSYSKNTNLPPSKAGIGSKFITPILTDNKAVKDKIANNPAPIYVFTIPNIPTKLDKSDTPICLTSLGAIKSFNVLKINVKSFQKFLNAAPIHSKNEKCVVGDTPIIL